MALRYGYFDSEIIGKDNEGMPVFDRAESSDLFALLLASLVSDGVLAQPRNCFQVLGTGNGMKVEVQPGFGMVKGHFAYNDEKKELDMGVAPQKYSRIDRVVMRCNYLMRMVEIVVKQGTEAANPVPPELVRPSAGDYFELCLANIRLTAGQKSITQSSITDTRPNSSVCGYITQLIDHIDTEVFFAQFEAFYGEFVDKSETSYKEFCQMAQKAYQDFDTDITNYINALKKDSTDAYNNLVSLGESLYNDFNRNISGYMASLKSKGDADLAELTQQLLDFRNTHEAEFLAWFDRIRGMLGTDPAGNLANGLEGLAGRMEDVEEMLFTGMVRAELVTSNGDSIIDSVGNTIVVGHPICRC